MIEISPEKVPDTDVATIKEWLAHPGRALFQEIIAHQEAACLASAANIRQKKEPQEWAVEAREKEIEANLCQNINLVFNQVTDPNHKFEKVSLRPPTVITKPNPQQ